MLGKKEKRPQSMKSLKRVREVTPSVELNGEPKQRRYDSLARLLSMSSNYSACTAISMIDNELIIAANCADGQKANDVALILNTKLTILRTHLRRIVNQSNNALIEHWKTGIDAFETSDFCNSVLTELKEAGGFFQKPKTLIQALYKTVRAVYNEEASTHLDVNESLSPEEIDLLLAGHHTILIPNEKEEEYVEDSSFDIDLVNKRFLATNTKNANIADSSYLLKSIACGANEIASTDSNDEESCADINGINLAELCISHTHSSRAHSVEDTYNSFYNLAIYKTYQPVGEMILNHADYPASINTAGKAPRSVNAFHAEQLIAYYLMNIKKIDLHDQEQPKIHIGISKLCCETCSILSDFSRLSIRGYTSQQIKGVTCLIEEPAVRQAKTSPLKRSPKPSFFEPPSPQTNIDSALKTPVSSPKSGNNIQSPWS